MPTVRLPLPPDLLEIAKREVPADLATNLGDPNVPLALLPVRLETRFFAQPDGTQELRVRVYPDQIHVDSHEPGLSSAELESGKRFWHEEWRAGGDELRRQAAWRELADRYDPLRAAWIARRLRPTNDPKDRPVSPLSGDAVLNPAPMFPADVPLQGGGGAWQRAPRAGLMPQRWIAVARAGGRVVAHKLGAPIVVAPALGPEPNAANVAADGLDEGMRWLSDFQTAEKVGMALRFTLDAAVAKAGLDVLLVFGVSSLDPKAGAVAVAKLLDAHHYTSGCSFVAPGTPTNNTEDAPSGLDSSDSMRLRSFDEEWRRFGQPLAPTSDGASVAAALGLAGIDEMVLSIASLPRAHAQNGLNARMMAAALWAPTWGYALTNLLSSGGVVPADLDWAREHFEAHVHAAGPLPFLRTGRQPYGLLPVTLLADWEPPAGEEAAHTRDVRLKLLLLDLRERLWRRRLHASARIGRSTDLEADLGAVLRGDGVANHYRTRHLMGPHYLQNLRRFLGEDLISSGWLAAQQRLTGAVSAQLQSLGSNWRPRLAGAAYDERVRSLLGVRVQVAAGALAPNYIDALLASPPILTGPLPAPASLLHVLLHHAVRLECLWGAARLYVGYARDTDLAALMRDSELVNLGASIAITWRTLLGYRNPPAGDQTIAQFIADGFATKTFSGRFAPLGRVRDAMRHLARLDAPTLDRLLVSTLDLASHRLDAWIGSFAAKRLAKMRVKSPTGLCVGAYGWVEDLRPAPTRNPLPTPTGEAGPVFPLERDAGFIHAPSITQAQTAALLRQAHLSHAREGATNLFAVDLSSRRVRLAAELLDGVRQGQPLSALLGYRVERGLHEHKLDHLIDDLRARAPLRAADMPPPGTAVEAFLPRNVVDGLRLHALWDAQRKNPTEPFKTCAPVLAELDDAVDAMADTLLAEAAHQAVRGNTVRAAATLQAMAAGEQPPPELEFVRTPRSGLAITHRVAALLPDSVELLRGWPGPAQSPRALAEPRLDAWAGRLLGAADRVRIVVERRVGAAVKTRHEVRGHELGLRPLDVLALAPLEPGASAPQLAAHALRVVRSKFGGEATGETLRVDPLRGADFGVNDLAFGDLATLGALARRLLGHARALDGRDLQALSEPSQSGVDATEIELRASHALEGIASATTRLASVLAAPQAQSLALRAAMDIRTDVIRVRFDGPARMQSAQQVGCAPRGRLVQTVEGNTVGRLACQVVGRNGRGRRAHWLEFEPRLLDQELQLLELHWLEASTELPASLHNCCEQAQSSVRVADATQRKRVTDIQRPADSLGRAYGLEDLGNGVNRMPVGCVVSGLDDGNHRLVKQLLVGALEDVART